ncbi:MAG: hypothetical protein E4H26_02630, partial [Flavobacteriales bacterium]
MITTIIFVSDFINFTKYRYRISIQMKILGFILFVLFLSCNSSQRMTAEPAQDPSPVISAMNYAETIKEAKLKEHLYTYASDEYEGRETGQPGQKKAVEYLKAQYIQMGIPAAQGGKNYFQDVPLEVGQIPEGEVILNGDRYDLGVDFLTFQSIKASFAQIVYVGYGIED